jgi:predicted nucleic acid-binding protein
VTTVAVYDANVLYPSALRDVLIRIGMKKLVQPKWTNEILDETFRNLSENRPDLDPAKLEITRARMSAAIRDVSVEGYEQWIEQIILPDLDDRHVLAAAVQAKATVIVTKNLRDFPKEELSKWGVVAQHPDIFLLDLYADNPEPVLAVIADMAAVWRLSNANPRDVVKQLANDAPILAGELLSRLAK